MSDKVTKDRDQKAAEAEVEHFHQELGPFVIAADTTRMPMVFTDAKPGNPIIYVNDAFLKLTGYNRDELLAHDFRFLLPYGNDRENLDRAEEAFNGNKETADLRCRHKDGSTFYASIFVNSVTDSEGKVV